MILVARKPLTSAGTIQTFGSLTGGSVLRIPRERLWSSHGAVIVRPRSCQGLRPGGAHLPRLNRPNPPAASTSRLAGEAHALAPDRDSRMLLLLRNSPAYRPSATDPPHHLLLQVRSAATPSCELMTLRSSKPIPCPCGSLCLVHRRHQQDFRQGEVSNRVVRDLKHS